MYDLMGYKYNQLDKLDKFATLNHKNVIYQLGSQHMYYFLGMVHLLDIKSLYIVD
jgi:hypothetical protein